MVIDEHTVADAVREAMEVARLATKTHVDRYGHGECGFAWVITHERGTSRVVRLLKYHGFRRGYDGGYVLWNPGGGVTQSMPALIEGAAAAAKVLTQKLGVEFLTGSHLD